METVKQPRPAVQLAHAHTTLEIIPSHMPPWNALPTNHMASASYPSPHRRPPTTATVSDSRPRPAAGYSARQSASNSSPPAHDPRQRSRHRPRPRPCPWPKTRTNNTDPSALDPGHALLHLAQLHPEALVPRSGFMVLSFVTLSKDMGIASLSTPGKDCS